MGSSSPRTGGEIAALYETHVDMLYRLCFTLLRNRPDTEDAVQTTFIKRLKHDRPFDSAEHEKAWLIVTASNTCKDMLRRSGRYDEPLEEHASALLSAEVGAERLDVLDAVLSLPLTYRTVVYLYYYEGYTAAEIAGMQKRPASTVRNRLADARKLLKSKLGGVFDEE